jgi:pantoate--beta-alanine ligase
MQTLHRIAALRTRLAAWRQAGERIVLVPTMGNLHQGHIRLVEVAQTLADRSVASLFVNPMQFGPQEDFNSYPRTLEADSRQLTQAGLDLLFAPPVAEVYPHGLENLTRVEVPGLSQILCGASRPIHFAGVATVVTKLFNMVQPDVAVFGEKDWQQLLVIRRLVADLNMPVEIVGVPTVREADGLALSSRNGYLSAAGRAVAPTLYATLRAAAERLRVGERDYQVIQQDAGAALEQAGFRPDYFAIRRAADLAEPVPGDTDLRILAAAWLGQTRLIDNCPVTVPAAA